MSNIKSHRFALLAAVVLAAGGSTAALADDLPGSMVVRATVSASCSIDAIDPLEFGTLITVGNSSTPERDAQAELKLTCSDGTAWKVYAGSGEHDDGSGQRRVANSGETAHVNYNLALDVSQTIPVPTTEEGAEGTLASGTGTDAQQSFTIYGRIPAGQTIPQADSYSDQVLFTVSF